MSVETQRVRFIGAAGSELVGLMDMPDGKPRGQVLFAHCFTCSKDLKPVVRVSKALAAAGFSVLRFDFTGHGESEGEFAETNFSSNLDDLVAAADYLARDYRPVDLLVGHSLGGAAVLAAAERIPDARAVATIAAPSSTAFLRRRLLTEAPELETADEALVDVAGRSVRIRRQLLDDLDGEHLSAGISALDRPLIVFHSPDDEVVGIDNAQRILEAARHPKSFVSIDGADHLLLARKSDSQFIGSVMATWALRYITSTSEAGTGRELPETVAGEVVVEAAGDSYLNIVRAGGHQLTADEPVALGGTDAGPTPYDLLLASLGTCKSITLSMYAERKGWPLKSIRIWLKHEKVHAKDCEECTSEKGKVDRIDVQLDLEGALDAQQRERLLGISERCPVHRTLTTETSIRSSLAASEPGSSS